MRYLKKFNEMLDPMGNWNPSQLDSKDDEYDGVPSRYDEDGEIIDDTDDFCPNCDCIPCQCTGEEYDEDLKEGLEENFTDWRINSYLKIARQKYNGMTSEEIISKIDNGPESMRFKNEGEKELFKKKWDIEKKEGTFAYYNAMTKEELKSLQKTFKHDFENPAQHDPKFVAYLKACELKKVFKDKDQTPRNLKSNKMY